MLQYLFVSAQNKLQIKKISGFFVQFIYTRLINFLVQFLIIFQSDKYHVIIQNILYLKIIKLSLESVQLFKNRIYKKIQKIKINKNKIIKFFISNQLQMIWFLAKNRHNRTNTNFELLIFNLISYFVGQALLITLKIQANFNKLECKQKQKSIRNQKMQLSQEVFLFVLQRLFQFKISYNQQIQNLKQHIQIVSKYSFKIVFCSNQS
ncbi:transmembrane protein, putative (macronuclear) [Tetrahymena thermophila SB210]|uniref:Transmembrane protein, putative n=1 Tax=Tetrahymena thermophila (strain SB210) TaxID=312017 RepID=W7XCZ2_TETTS|nr:transmembrane protein, putative [Tetrahymena thermophila SB210]EWS71681.1 transmembrane protein, putative [Tetrahymena thermophila SB210]|eukprot:XP_012655792.1 transmembrane protein, putative [Tetrahymena thermophila SB210]